MEQFTAVLNQVIVFLIIIIIGYVAVKIKFLPVSALPVITVIFTRVIVPFLVFINTVNGATREDMVNYIYLSGIYLCIFAALIVLARILPKILRLKGNKASLFSLANTFGNVGFVGIPLLLAIFGQRVMVFVTMWAIVDQTLFWTYGFTLTFPVDKKLKFDPKNLVNMINPPFIAVILSVILIMLNIRLPVTVDRAFTTVSNAGMALPFIYIGGTLATLSIKELLKNYEIYIGMAIKMVIIPICVFVILQAIGLDRDIVLVSAILCGLPSIGLIPMLASVNGSDAEYGTVIVLITTISCIFTLTLVSYVTSFIV